MLLPLGINKMLKPSDAGKNLNLRWPIFQTTGDSPLDASAKA